MINELSVQVITAESSVQLHLQGALTIQNAGRIKSELLTALNSASHLIIICNNPANIDLAVIQLFIATNKTGISSGKKVDFHLDLSAQQELLLAHSGIRQILLRQA